MASIARKQRRMNYRDAGFLKVKNMFSRFSPQGIAWYAKMAEDGAAANEAYQKFVNDSIADQLQNKLNRLKETWTGIGYNASEIKKLEEAFSITVITDKDTYRADRKLARKLQKEAQASLLSRAA
jgi:hypothetical protein|tara:strand:- start:909 stop:1283 length:375 start_codon:yes stop_codon:yes gene_type:complete